MPNTVKRASEVHFTNFQKALKEILWEEGVAKKKYECFLLPTLSVCFYSLKIPQT